MYSLWTYNTIGLRCLFIWSEFHMSCNLGSDTVLYTRWIVRYLQIPYETKLFSSSNFWPAKNRCCVSTCILYPLACEINCFSSKVVEESSTTIRHSWPCSVFILTIHPFVWLSLSMMSAVYNQISIWLFFAPAAELSWFSSSVTAYFNCNQIAQLLLHTHTNVIIWPNMAMLWHVGVVNLVKKCHGDLVKCSQWTCKLKWLFLIESVDADTSQVSDIKQYVIDHWLAQSTSTIIVTSPNVLWSTKLAQNNLHTTNNTTNNWLTTIKQKLLHQNITHFTSYYCAFHVHMPQVLLCQYHITTMVFRGCRAWFFTITFAFNYICNCLNCCHWCCIFTTSFVTDSIVYLMLCLAENLNLMTPMIRLKQD